jgi:hypothetical protein
MSNILFFIQAFSFIKLERFGLAKHINNKHIIYALQMLLSGEEGISDMSDMSSSGLYSTVMKFHTLIETFDVWFKDDSDGALSRG